MPRREKPNLLFAARQWPARTGGGTPMRMGMVLEALARDYAVHMLCVAISQRTPVGEIEERYRKLCARIIALDVKGREDPAFAGVTSDSSTARLLAAHRATPRTYLARHATPAMVGDIMDAVGDVPFDVIHVSRLFMAPFVEPLLRPPARGARRCVLDLDDIESETHARIAALHEKADDKDRARAMLIESGKLADLERTCLPLFDEVWVCSEHDRRAVAHRYAHTGVFVVPNAVRLPTRSRPKPPSETATLLFLGLMAYYPNEDAAVWLCRDILPRIRRRTKRPVRVVIAGHYRSERVRELAREPGVSVLGPVPDVKPCYREADVAVVPLRAGGGTRIKILEAFSLRRPVVTTTIGVEGLDISLDSHLLVADSADEFAAACVALIEDPRRAEVMAHRAYAWVSSHHTSRQVRDSIRAARRYAARGPAANPTSSTTLDTPRAASDTIPGNTR